MEEKRDDCRVLVGKRKGWRQLEVPMHRWEYNIKLYRRVGLEQIDLAQDRDRWRALAKTEINYCVSYYVGKFLTN
jgi:hypothetical protein